MNTTEKKFLFPRLYPLTYDISKKWFIKYQVEDFTTGGFKYEKYYGALNLITDKEERLKTANDYLLKMKRGEPLPVYQGMKRLRAQEPESNFANAVQCCYKYVSDRRNELAKDTISQYKSRINFFHQWLCGKKLSHLAIGGITKDTARDFLNYLIEEKKFSSKTYNDYKILFGCIWQQYVEDDKIRKNPWKQIDSLPDQPVHFASYPPELRKLLRETLPEHDRQLWLFMQCIYYCAIRPDCELRKMQVRDLIVSKQRFIVRQEIAKGPKGKKRARVVNISKHLFSQLLKLRYHEYPPDYYLFSVEGVPGEKMVSEHYFRSRWNAYKKLHNIPAVYKIYGSKHTGGKLLSFLFNEFVTKEHFGHRSMDSTRQYTEDIDKDALNVLQKKYPKF